MTDDASNAKRKRALTFALWTVMSGVIGAFLASVETKDYREAIAAVETAEFKALLAADDDAISRDFGALESCFVSAKQSLPDRACLVATASKATSPNAVYALAVHARVYLGAHPEDRELIAVTRQAISRAREETFRIETTLLAPLQAVLVARDASFVMSAMDAILGNTTEADRLAFAKTHLRTLDRLDKAELELLLPGVAREQEERRIALWRRLP